MSWVLRTILQKGRICGWVCVLVCVHLIAYTWMCVLWWIQVYIYGAETINNSLTQSLTLTVCFNVIVSFLNQFPRNVPNTFSRLFFFFKSFSWCPLNVCFIITSWKEPKPSFLSWEQLCRQNTHCETENVSHFVPSLWPWNITKQAEVQDMCLMSI